jgi:hypothetical protein
LPGTADAQWAAERWESACPALAWVVRLSAGLSCRVRRSNDGQMILLRVQSEPGNSCRTGVSSIVRRIRTPDLLHVWSSWPSPRRASPGPRLTAHPCSSSSSTLTSPCR